MSTKGLLLLGARGLLGRRLRATLAHLGPIISPSRDEVDITRADQVESAVRGLRPRFIVNAAAMTNVDVAEANPGKAFAVNAEGAANIARAAARHGACMVHYSTDYVFAGDAAVPYAEGDPARPVNAYGASKLAGENAVIAEGAAGILLRVCWMYSHEGRGFPQLVLGKLAQDDFVHVRGDQWSTPSSVTAVARATAVLLMRFEREGCEQASVLHMSSGESVSRVEYARAVASLVGQSLKIEEADGRELRHQL